MACFIAHYSFNAREAHSSSCDCIFSFVPNLVLDILCMCYASCKDFVHVTECASSCIS